MSNEKKSFFYYRYEIGLVLLIIGVPLSNIIKELAMADVIGSNLIMIASVVLLFHFDIMKIHKYSFLFIVYQFIILAASVFSGITIMHENYGGIYTAFVIIIALELGTFRKAISWKFFINALWIITGVSQVLICFILTNGFTNFVSKSYTYLPMGTDRLTLTRMALVYFACFLYMLKIDRGKIVKGLNYAFMFLSLYVVIALKRRSYLILYAIMFTAYCIRERKDAISIKKVANIILTCFGIIISVLILFKNIPGVEELFSDYMSSVSEAFKTFFGFITNTSAIDQSALTRVLLREQYWNIFMNEYNISEFMFGRGYMSCWIDLPIFQIFLDMGLIGGLAYIVINGYIIIKVWGDKSKDKVDSFMSYYSIIPLSSNFIGGFPYGYTVYLPMLILLHYLEESSENRTEERIEESV